MNKKTIKDIEIQGKKVLVRVDFNVSLDRGGNITNENRITAALPTLKYILENGGKVIAFSHLGRVRTAEDKNKLSMKVVAQRLSELLKQTVKFIPQTRGAELETAVESLNNHDILIFENTRFEDLDGKKESKNDPELGKYWAGLGDIFVNDAFGTAHRAHASNVGIATHLPSVAGFLLEREIEFIGGVVESPKKPLVAILGGAKISDKILVIENLLNKADTIIIGGGMSYTFSKALGGNIGNSLCKNDMIDYAKELMQKAKDKGVDLVLPIDSVIADEFSNDANKDVAKRGCIPDKWEGLDIGPESRTLFTSKLQGAKTIVWNGPMGVFELESFTKGTTAICEAIAQLKEAITIIGGGDSATAAIQLGFEKDFTHISTGGGASLAYLEGKKLPGIECLS